VRGWVGGAIGSDAQDASISRQMAAMRRWRFAFVFQMRDHGLEIGGNVANVGLT
jgi:hypothetical protein